MILLGRLGLIEDYPEEGIDLKKINEFTTQYDIVNPEDNCKCEDLSQLKVNPLKDHVVDKLKRNAVSQAKKSCKKAEAEFKKNFVGPLPKRKVGRPKGSVNRKNTEFEKNFDSMTMSASGVNTPVPDCQSKSPIETNSAASSSKELLNETQDRSSNDSMTMSANGVSTPVSEYQPKPPIEADSAVSTSKKLLNNSQYGQTFASGCITEDVYDFDNEVQFEHQLCDSQYDANSYQEMNCTGVSKEDVMWFE